MHQRALAAAAGADQGNLLAGADVQVQLLQDLVLAVGEIQPAHLDANGRAAGERIAQRRVARLVGPRQQLVDPLQRAASGVVGVLQAEQLFDRTDHEPEVAEHREHLADRQVREQHGKHRRGAEHIDAELEQQAAGAPGGVAFPLRGHSVVADFLGAMAEAAEEIALAIAGADFLDRLEGLGERLGEARGAVVLELLEVLDALAQLYRRPDHQRVEQQDQQGQLPVHPDQDRGGAEQRQQGDQEAAEGFPDELVQGVQAGHQAGADRTAAEGFVFAQGDMPEALDQTQADAVDDVLGQPREQLRLEHVEHQRRPRNRRVAASIRPM